MKRALLLSTFTLPVTVVMLAAPAQAACVSNAQVVTCSALTSGFSAGGSVGNLTITVNPYSVVANESGDGVRARGSNNTVINYGVIAGAETLTVDETGERLTGTDGIDGGNNLSVYNYGLITATNKGVDAEARNGLLIENHGTITAYDKAIRNQDGLNGRLYNYGLIESEFDEGFESGDNAYVYNGVGASIIGSDDAIQVGEGATIENHGLIHSVARGGDEANPQDGIDIDSGTINNYATGRILSDDDAAIDYDASDVTSYINNRGTISGTTGVLVEKGETGEDPNVAAQIIHNWGVIEGRNGLAVDLGAGDDSLTLYSGSTLIGGADFGADNDSLTLDGIFTVDIAGGSLLDGGTGLNTVSFLNYGIGDIISSLFGDDNSVALSFALDDTAFSINLANWTTFSFGNGDSYSYAALQDALSTPAPVPVPAAGLLLVSGLAGCAALRRRRG